MYVVVQIGCDIYTEIDIGTVVSRPLLHTLGATQGSDGPRETLQ